MPTAENVLIVQTYYVPASHIDRTRYEVLVAPDADEDTPRVTFVTRDEALYTRALEAEGTDRRFDAAWRTGIRSDGHRVQVLDTLTERSS